MTIKEAEEAIKEAEAISKAEVITKGEETTKGEEATEEEAIFNRIEEAMEEEDTRTKMKTVDTTEIQTRLTSMITVDTTIRRKEVIKKEGVTKAIKEKVAIRIKVTKDRDNSSINKKDIRRETLGNQKSNRKMRMREKKSDWYIESERATEGTQINYLTHFSLRC